MSNTAYFLRIFHFLISAYFFLCVLFMYYSILTGQESKLLYIAIISILIEGIIIFLNQNNCPLGPLHKKYGDSKTFFELFFPMSIAQQVIPFIATVSVIGLIIFFIQRLLTT